MKKPTVDLLKIGITALKKQYEKEEKWQKTFNEMFDGHLVPQFSSDLENAIIKMLQIAYNDKTETISWWIYEQEFGKKCRVTPAMWGADGTPIHLRNIDELYKFLIEDGFGENETDETIDLSNIGNTKKDDLDRQYQDEILNFLRLIFR